MSQSQYRLVLRAKFARASPQLLAFLDFPGQVDVTNNACERALRPAVIQRKNTNGFKLNVGRDGRLRGQNRDRHGKADRPQTLPDNSLDPRIIGRNSTVIEGGE